MLIRAFTSSVLCNVIPSPSSAEISFWSASVACVALFNTCKSWSRVSMFMIITVPSWQDRPVYRKSFPCDPPSVRLFSLFINDFAMKLKLPKIPKPIRTDNVDTSIHPPRLNMPITAVTMLPNKPISVSNVTQRHRRYWLGFFVCIFTIFFLRLLFKDNNDLLQV